MDNKVEKTKKDITIPHIHPDIVDAIINHELVLFIGAGVSSLCGLPLWSTFANNLLINCYNKGYLTSLEYHNLQTNLNDAKIKISVTQSIYSENNDEKSFYKDFRKQLRKKNKQITDSGREVLDFINKTNATVITTNADLILDEYFDKWSIFYKESSYKNIPNQGRNLIKIHGSVLSSKSLVFTTEQYLHRYRDDEFRKYLKGVFGSKTILFIGYGLSEFELLDYMQLKTSNEDNNSKLFVLNGYYSSQDTYKKYMDKYYRKINITQISYCMDDQGYDELARVLREWTKQIQNETNVKAELLKRIDEDVEVNNMKDINKLVINDDTLNKYCIKRIFDSSNTTQNLEDLISYGFFKLL